MSLGILSSTRCLAIAFQQEFAFAVRAFNIYDVFKSFLNVNAANTTNPYLSQALKKCLLLGHIEPFVILIGGDEMSLRTLKSCWMRAQLQPPPGFRIESIGDAGGLILNSVPQYASMRLEEVIFQVICQVSMLEPTCSESRLYGHLANIYAEMQSHLPPRQSVYAAISSLIKSGLIYYCGQGYNLMTPDKMHVANWLRSLPSSGDLGADYRPPTRLEVSKASLVLNLPPTQQPTMTAPANLPRPPPSPSSIEKTDTAEEEPPSFRSSEDQMLFPPFSSPVPTPPNHTRPSTSNLTNRLSARHLQQQLSQMKREASSTSRLNGLNRSRLLRSQSPPPGGPSGPLIPHPVEKEVVSPRAGVSTSTSFNTSLHEHQSALPRNSTHDFKRRAQLSQSVYLSSGEPTRHSHHQLGRPLGEQQSSRFAKSADFQSPNTAFGGEQPVYHGDELKKHGSSSLLQWFKQGVRKLRNSLRRSLSRDEWPAQSMPSFPMFYQNTTTANSVTPIMRGHKRQPSWHSKTHQCRSRTVSARGSSGDVYPLHSVLPRIEHDRGSSVSNLRRCLSLAESQNREIGNGAGNIPPFSMEVIPETDLQTSSQNLGPSPYLRRDSTMEQIFAWQQGAASMLSLNATPNGVSGADRSSQSDSRNMIHAPTFPESIELHPNGTTFFPSRNESLPNNNYMARSGRDSGFIDITSHQNFAQMDSSAYSVIHSRQLSEPITQEPSDVKEITDAFEGLASDALRGSGPLLSAPSLQVPTSSREVNGMGVDKWWTAGFATIQQSQQQQQQQRQQMSVNNSGIDGGIFQNWNVYQNGIFSSTSGETQPLQAT